MKSKATVDSRDLVAPNCFLVLLVLMLLCFVVRLVIWSSGRCRLPVIAALSPS